MKGGVTINYTITAINHIPVDWTGPAHRCPVCNKRYTTLHTTCATCTDRYRPETITILDNYHYTYGYTDIMTGIFHQAQDITHISTSKHYTPREVQKKLHQTAIAEINAMFYAEYTEDEAPF